MGAMVSGKRSTPTTQIFSSLTASIAKSEKRFSGFEVVWEAIAYAQNSMGRGSAISLLGRSSLELNRFIRCIQELINI
jgi:hypothetical protein